MNQIPNELTDDIDIINQYGSFLTQEVDNQELQDQTQDQTQDQPQPQDPQHIQLAFNAPYDPNDPTDYRNGPRYQQLNAPFHYQQVPPPPLPIILPDEEHDSDDDFDEEYEPWAKRRKISEPDEKTFNT